MEWRRCKPDTMQVAPVQRPVRTAGHYLCHSSAHGGKAARGRSSNGTVCVRLYPVSRESNVQMNQDVLTRNNVRVFGRGTRPLMFAHGFGCDQNMWRLVTPAFEEEYRIVLFDYVGSGRSNLDAYDPATGTELWRIKFEGFSVVPRPVYGNGMVYLTTGFYGPLLLAIRPDGEGDVTATHIAWQVSRGIPLISSPLLDGERRETVEQDISLPRVYMAWITPRIFVPSSADVAA